MQLRKAWAKAKTGRPSSDAGFSLIELLVAMMILIVGLMATATLILSGLALSLQSKDLAVANQLAKEGMEAVFTARILGTISYNQLRNQINGGIFLDGYQPINLTGSDGLINTATYGNQPPLRYIDPGKNGVYETPSIPASVGPPPTPAMPFATTLSDPVGDDKIISFERFQRQVLIATDPTDPNIRRVTVNVQVTNNGQTSLATSLTTVMGAIN